jgi:two-component system, OmpR family, phosphate regulon response regulator PhoB
MTAAAISESTKPVVVFVEDDEDVGNLVAFNLRAANLDVVTIEDIASAPAAVARHHPLVIVVDRMLPDGDGITLCTRFRADAQLRDVGLLLLSALGSENDRIDGFAAGADDYVVKPFSVRELVARVRILVDLASDRRAARASGRKDASFRWRQLVVDAASCRVMLRGAAIELRPVELKLLCKLIEARGAVLSRAAILKAVWGAETAPHTRAVDVHIQRLRVALGDHQDVVETVHGAGYRLALTCDKTPGHEPL